MSTLLKQESGSGTRKCDAHCYNAKGAVCSCICEGVNHGKGFGAALDNTLTGPLPEGTVTVPLGSFQVVIPKKRTPIRDTVTGIVHESKYAAGKSLCQLIQGSPLDRYVYFKLEKAFPGRFQEVVGKEAPDGDVGYDQGTAEAPEPSEPPGGVTGL